MKSCVIIPTYNERDNVEAMARVALAALPQDGHILFVDDNSPDGTGKLIDELATAEGRIHCLHRPGKQGLGRAYVAGMQWALANGAEFICEMDCDFSHDPNDLPRLIAAAETECDVANGSRYVAGGKCVNWPFKRLLISRAGGIFIRLMTGLPLRDPTGGFRCFRRKVLQTLNLDSIQSSGYSFQLEMNYRAWLEGFIIKELPITFSERRAGESKITTGIAIESLKMVFRLRKIKR